MKQLPFREADLSHDPLAERVLLTRLRGSRWADIFSEYRVSVLTNLALNEAPAKSLEPIVTTFVNMAEWITGYVALVLDRNPAVERICSAPYRMGLAQKIDFRKRLYESTYQVDSRVYSLVVGSEHRNIVHVVRSLFPVFAKNSFECNIAFSPFSNSL